MMPLFWVKYTFTKPGEKKFFSQSYEHFLLMVLVAGNNRPSVENAVINWAEEKNLPKGSVEIFSEIPLCFCKTEKPIVVFGQTL